MNQLDVVSNNTSENPNGAHNKNIASHENQSFYEENEEEEENYKSKSKEPENPDQLINGDKDENEFSEEYEISVEDNNISKTEIELEENEEEYELNENKVEDSNLLNAKKLEINQNFIIKNNSNESENNSNYNNNLNESENQQNSSINLNSINSEAKMKTKITINSENSNKDDSRSLNAKPNVKFAIKYSHSTKTKTKISENIEEEFNLNKKLNKYDFDFENEKIEENLKFELNKNIISDTPYNKKSSDDKVKFSKKFVFLEYDDETVVEDIKVMDQMGNPEKHSKFNLLKYLIRLKNNKHKCKKILRNYYNGIREDRLPKKIISSLKKTNTFNEEDKVIGLQKLNEFLHECNKENLLSESVEKKKKKMIGKFFISFFIKLKFS